MSGYELTEMAMIGKEEESKMENMEKMEKMDQKAVTFESENTRAQALEVVDSAIDYFAQFQPVFDEYYKCTGKKWIGLSKRLIAPGIVGAVMTGSGVYELVSYLVKSDVFSYMPVLKIMGVNMFQLFAEEGGFAIIAGVTVMLATGAIHIVRRFKKKALKERICQLEKQLEEIYEDFEMKELVSKEYALPQILQEIRQAIKAGKADTIEEAGALVCSNIRRVRRGKRDVTLRNAATAISKKKYFDNIKDEAENNVISFVA